jgi:hypothetical protein
MEWNTPSSATIHAAMKPGQVLAVQVTWNPAWRAKVGGREIQVRKDGLGLMVIEPECNGECEVHLDYGTTPQIWFCRAGSGLVALMLVVTGIRPTFQEHAQDGHGVRRAAQRAKVFLHCLAARIRVLCAPVHWP